MRPVPSRCLPVLVVLTLSFSPAWLLAQDRPSFEVVSVRPGLPSGRLAPRPPFARSTGQFDAADTLRHLIAWAFQPHAMEGSFKELDQVFVIAAKAAGPVRLAPSGEVSLVNQMVQSLLADRFKLKVRWETRSFPVYVLRRATLEQLGKNLKPIDTPCPDGYPDSVDEAPNGCAVRLVIDQGRISGAVPRIADFARVLSPIAERHVVDDTGLIGRFELSTRFIANPSTVSGLPIDLADLRDALRNDLGLKLDSERRDSPVLIVEHVEQPAEN